MSPVPVRLDVSEDQGCVPCVTSVSVGAKPIDIRPSAYVGFPEGINPLSPNRDQHQFSPNNNIHTLSKRKCLDLLLNSLNNFLQEVYGDLFGEFVCGYWGLKS